MAQAKCRSPISTSICGENNVNKQDSAIVAHHLVPAVLTGMVLTCTHVVNVLISTLWVYCAVKEVATQLPEGRNACQY